MSEEINMNQLKYDNISFRLKKSLVKTRIHKTICFIHNPLNALKSANQTMTIGTVMIHILESWNNKRQATQETMQETNCSEQRESTDAFFRLSCDSLAAIWASGVDRVFGVSQLAFGILYHHCIFINTLIISLLVGGG